MSQRDGDLIQQTVTGLEDETRAQPDGWRRQLDEARRHALRHSSRPAPAHWAWAGAAAAAAALAVLLLVALPRPGAPPAPPPVAESDLYEDMEFYLWLAEELESPSPSRS